MNEGAHEGRRPERGAVFLAQLHEHRPLDAVAMELLLDALGFVGADHGRHGEGDRRARAHGEDEPGVPRTSTDGERRRAGDDPEDREGSIERSDHEVPPDDRS